jgi:hypothetical protein
MHRPILALSLRTIPFHANFTAKAPWSNTKGLALLCYAQHDCAMLGFASRHFALLRYDALCSVVQAQSLSTTYPQSSSPSADGVYCASNMRI